MTVLATDALTFRYGGARVPAVDTLDMSVQAGAFHAVIGPNGSGKSTLLKLLLGVLAPTSGSARFLDRPVADWNRRDLARRIGVVAQNEELVFPVTVRELVSMGRYPHLGAWRRAGRQDAEAVARALARCELEELAARPVSTLSGGERQRARLARALAQEPSTLVLDEPTASLDIAHEMTMFELLSALAADDGVTVLVVTHNLNLAARYADRILLLDRGRAVAEGPPAQVLVRESIERVWEWPVHVFAHPGPGRDAGAPQIVPLAASSGAPDVTDNPRPGS
jgi:iron complex transport system ATP-binding protein